MQLMFTEKFKMILTFLAGTAILLTSCQKSYVFKIAEDPGYVTDPVIAVRALDGDRWIQGRLDSASKTVSFEFHVATSLEKIVLDVELNKKWAEMVSPRQAKFTANVKSGYKFTVNDGVNDVGYTVKASMYKQIVQVKATLDQETVTLSSKENSFIGSFPSAFLADDVKNVDLEVNLNEGVELITDPDNLKGLDFSDGEGVEVTVLDRSVNRKKSFMVYAKPSDVADIDDTWTEVTRNWGTEFNINFGKVRMYMTEQLNGASGNVGYLFTVPAGYVEMMAGEKNTMSLANANISSVVRKYDDFVLFVPQQGPAIWHTDGSTAASDYEYYSPLAFGPDEQNVIKVLREAGFGLPGSGVSKKIIAPALGIKDGRLQIKPAGAVAGVLYCYDDVKGNGQASWDVEAAVGGQFQIVKDGVALVTGESERMLNTYNQGWRVFPDVTVNTTPAWKPEAIMVHDRLRTGRISIGCTAGGALIILAAEKFVNTHNQGQHVDAGRNGDGRDTRGLTLCELSQMMARLGCSDAMTVEDYNWSYIILQDGSERGKDLFWTNSRWYIAADRPGYKTMKPETEEFANLVTLCIK